MGLFLSGNSSRDTLNKTVDTKALSAYSLPSGMTSLATSKSIEPVRPLLLGEVMPTLASVFPEELLVRGPVIIEPGPVIKFTVDATIAFSKNGGLPVEGAEEAAVVTHATNLEFGPDNCLCVNDAHMPGCAHSVKTFTDEARVVPNVTQLTPELIARWQGFGAGRILRPHAQFGLDGLLMSTLVSKAVTGRWPTIWSEHGVFGTLETTFIGPVTVADYTMVHYKGTHPLYDSHDGIMDASGKPVGTLERIAARRIRTQAIVFDGNAFEVCKFLTMKRSALLLRHLNVEIYCLVDATGFLPFIDQKIRVALINELRELGVKFVHSTQLQFN